MCLFFNYVSALSLDFVLFHCALSYVTKELKDLLYLQNPVGSFAADCSKAQFNGPDLIFVTMEL